MNNEAIYNFDSIDECIKVDNIMIGIMSLVSKQEEYNKLFELINKFALESGYSRRDIAIGVYNILAFSEYNENLLEKVILRNTTKSLLTELKEKFVKLVDALITFCVNLKVTVEQNKIEDIFIKTRKR